MSVQAYYNMLLIRLNVNNDENNAIIEKKKMRFKSL